MYKPFRPDARGTTLLRGLAHHGTTVINHLLSGMIFQVLCLRWSKQVTWIPEKIVGSNHHLPQILTIDSSMLATHGFLDKHQSGPSLIPKCWLISLHQNQPSTPIFVGRFWNHQPIATKHSPKQNIWSRQGGRLSRYKWGEITPISIGLWPQLPSYKGHL